MGSGAKPQKLENFRKKFVLKVILQSVRLLLAVSYRKKMREQDVLVAPPIVLLGSLFPVFRAYGHNSSALGAMAPVTGQDFVARDVCLRRAACVPPIIISYRICLQINL